MATTDDIAKPLPNIIILTPEEQVIDWLIPDLTDVNEINEKDKVRKIELTYPIEDRLIYDEERPWFSQGNKVFIPAIFGMTNCLYVINTEYQIDYWDKNHVTIQAEEVLTELNNQVVGVYSKNSIKITADRLKEWFGRWYTIGTIESLATAKNSIQQLGTVTLMTLLRTIEEKTERVFLTEYTYQDNIITRKLSLVKEDTLRQTAGTEFLDLNYNLDSLDLTVSEEKTYNAMAPELSINEQKGTSSADYVNANDSRTNTAAVQNTLTAEEIYQNWLDLEVEYREEIPMIQEKQSDGQVVTTQKWYAPFIKAKGNLYIENPAWSSSKYTYIQPPANPSVSTKDKIPNPIPRCGTVSTSETDAYAIYNVLANSLLEKLNPQFELNIKVSDITQMLGNKNLGYNLYETLYVKVPGFDYWVPAYITKTTKNPHEPGNDTITIETDVKGSHYRKPTQLLLENALIAKNATLNSYGGILTDEDGNPIANQLVTVNVRLKEAYMALPTATASIKGFDPRNNTYYFSKEEILILEKTLRKGVTSDVTIYDIRGKPYSVSPEWCLAIYYTYIQQYINSDYPRGAGKFPDSVAVHYYENATEKLKTNNNVLYYPSFYMEYIDKKRKFYQDNNIASDGHWCKICSSELQSGGTCVANAVANACAFNFMYHTESEVLQLMGSTPPTTGNVETHLMPVLKKLGFNYQVVACTRDNIKKYVQNFACALIGVSGKDLYGYDTDEGHQILIIDWYYKDDNMKVIVADSNRGYMNPASANQFTIHSPEYDVDRIINMIIETTRNGKVTGRSSKSQTPVMIIIESTDQQKAEVAERRTQKVVPTSSTNGAEDFLDLLTTYFKVTDLKTAWKTTIASSNKLNKTFDIKDTTGVTRHINVFYMYALAFTYICKFYNTQINIPLLQNTDIKSGPDSNTTRFYKILQNEQQLPSTAQIVKVLDAKQNKYILTWILFQLGYLVPPVTTWGVDTFLNSYSDTDVLTVSAWTNILKHYDSNVTTKLVDFTESNVKGYATNYVCFTYIDKTYAESIGNPTVARSNYPAFIINHEGVLKLYLIHMEGEVPAWVTGTTGQSNAGYCTVVKFSDIVLSATNTEFKNKVLVISNKGGLG